MANSNKPTKEDPKVENLQAGKAVLIEELFKSVKEDTSKHSFDEKILNNDFYFEEGKKALNAIENLGNNLVILKDFLKKAKGKDWYSNMQKNEDFKELIEPINNFVAYCDINAKGAKKRCIARAGIYQNAWIKNIAQYLVNIKEDPTKPYEEVTYGVMRAIEYFKRPNEVFPILSKKHQEAIAKFFGISSDSFDEELKSYFNKLLLGPIQEFSGEQFNKENLTSFYTSLIYEINSEWAEKKNLDIFNEVVKTLSSNKNLILSGAPGTGKTYLAKDLARFIIGLDNDDEKDECKSLESSDQFGFVQFHPSYDYTDFVEGLRPKKNDNGEIIFEHVDGIFKKFCKKALDKPEEKFVFVIDEINRGEISKIFGELFFSIDPGYRGVSGAVRTQYANIVTEPNIFDEKLGKEEEGSLGNFFVPDNVYIIGTMNDIDRSVESMDFAFRRRFAFYEILAEKTDKAIFSELVEEDQKIAKEAMKALNKKLEDASIGLTNAYHIGASYFAKIKLYSRQSTNKWNSLWNYHLKGTLYEYFRGEPDADKKIGILEKAYNDVVKKNNKPQATNTSNAKTDN